MLVLSLTTFLCDSNPAPSGWIGCKVLRLMDLSFVTKPPPFEKSFSGAAKIKCPGPCRPGLRRITARSVCRVVVSCIAAIRMEVRLFGNASGAAAAEARLEDDSARDCASAGKVSYFCVKLVLLRKNI